MHRLALLLLASVLSPQPSVHAVDVDGIHFNEQSSQHFDVRFRGAWMPKGLVFTIEEIHRKLEFRIGMLNPSLMSEKKRFVLYKDKEEYLASPFKPPSWSMAIAIPRVRGLFTYEMADQAEFRSTLAHELTHLMFGTYFMEAKATPPRWLDEGLAMLMEDQINPGADGKSAYYWTNSRALLGRDRVKPMAEFAGSEPKGDWSKEDVRDWYFQAYLMTRFLFLEHSKLQFKSFCNALRQGDDLRYAMQKVYGLKNLGRFDQSWLQYAGLPAARPKENPEIGSSSQFHAQPVKFLDISSEIFKRK